MLLFSAKRIDVYRHVFRHFGASKRENYKIITDNNTYIATYSENTKETDFFIYLTETFKKKGLNVPQIS
jgi:hypothetical protein